jgi:hypothetical protein
MMLPAGIESATVALLAQRSKPTELRKLSIIASQRFHSINDCEKISLKVLPAGIEPATVALLAQRSNQLS